MAQPLPAPSAAPAVVAAMPSLDLAFELVRSPSLHVKVTERVEGSPEGQTLFAVADGWGGVEDVDRDMAGFVAFDRQGGELAVERPKRNRWLVHHPPGEPLTVSYRLVATSSQLDWTTRYRLVLNEQLFHLPAMQGLALPQHLDEEQRARVSFRWKGFREAGWNVVASLGSEPAGFDVVETPERLWQSVFLAGPLRLQETPVLGGKLQLAVAGDWSFTDQALGELAARVIDAERSFFDDRSEPRFLVALLPTGAPDGASHGGSGLTNSFAMYLAPRSDLGLSVKQLLAHEYFHNWNGHTIRVDGPSAYWFSEGFTNFYRRRLLYRSGLITLDEFAIDLNASIEKLFFSPSRRLSNAEVTRDLWKSQDIGLVPYRRGDLVAVLADAEIRRASAGARGLDGLMKQLVAEARSDPKRLTTDDLLGRLTTLTTPEVGARLRAIVVDGELPKLAGPLFGDCIDLATEARPRFELGFDARALRERRVIRDVLPGSAAERAGLREGQKATKISIWFGDVGKPVELTVSDGVAKKQIRYWPHSEKVELPRATPRAGAPASCRTTL